MKFPTKFKLSSTALLALHLTFAPTLAYAVPSGGSVVSGTATIVGTGSTLNINQSTNKAIINWQEFSIGQGETVNFDIASVNGATLNRVTGGNLSQILGTLSSNGQVFVINPNGVIVGSQGVINAAGGLVLSTHDIADQNFLDGGDLDLSALGANGGVVNLGKIQSTTGDVYLIANTVDNQGLIEAVQGRVGIAAAKGANVVLVQEGNQKLMIGVSDELLSQGEGVSNSGVISAVDAEIQAAGGNAYALAINNNGVIRATGTQTVGGRILLTSDAGNINIGEDSVIDASGDEQGGQINIGGNKQNQGEFDSASQVTVNAGANIAANGEQQGGQVIVWADDTLDFNASVEATGNTGGFVETSAAQLNIGEQAVVNTNGGDWLLDPVDFTIAASGGDITAATLISALASNNITIDTVNGGASVAGAPAAGDGDITVSEVISWSDATSLTLLAQGDVNINQSIQNSSAAIGGDINIVAGWDGVSAFDAATYNAETLASTAVFGANSGSVNIGNGSTTVAFVGSKSGSTSVYGYDVSVVAGTQNAQLGYAGADGATGAINVRATNDVLVKSANSNNDSAQIGHGGYRVARDSTTLDPLVYDGDITVEAGNNVTVGGGTGLRSYSLIGHGGEGFAQNALGDVTLGGDITVVSGGDVLLDGASRLGDTMIGHGGSAALAGVDGDAHMFGNIDITTGGDLTIQTGVNNIAAAVDAQVGHGGYHAMINLGVEGAPTVNSISGDIMTNIGGDLIVTNGTSALNQQTSKLGHGGRVGRDVIGDFTISGDIIIDQVNDILVESGFGGNTFASIGAMTLFLGQNSVGDLTVTGDIVINNANNITIQPLTGGSSFAKIGAGNGGWASGLVGNVTLEQNIDISANNIALDATQGGAGGFAAIGLGVPGLFNDGEGDLVINSNIDLAVAQELSLLGGGSETQPNVSASIGLNLNNAANSLLGSVTAAGDVTITAGNIVGQAGSGDGSFVSLGNSSPALGTNLIGDVSLGGDINITTTVGSIDWSAGAGSNAFAAIGNGGVNLGLNALGSVTTSGNIEVVSATDVILQAGEGSDAYVSIGNGGASTGEGASGDVTITGDICVEALTGNVSLSSGSGSDAYAQIGNGGESVGLDSGGNVIIDGDICIDAVGLNMTTGDGLDAYIQIGNGGENGDKFASTVGVIDVNAELAVTKSTVNPNNDVYIANRVQNTTINEETGAITESQSVTNQETGEVTITEVTTDILGNVTTVETVTDSVNGSTTVTTTHPDGTVTVEEAFIPTTQTTVDQTDDGAGNTSLTTTVTSRDETGATTKSIVTEAEDANGNTTVINTQVDANDESVTTWVETSTDPITGEVVVTTTVIDTLAGTNIVSSVSDLTEVVDLDTQRTTTNTITTTDENGVVTEEITVTVQTMDSNGVTVVSTDSITNQVVVDGVIESTTGAPVVIVDPVTGGTQTVTTTFAADGVTALETITETVSTDPVTGEVTTTLITVDETTGETLSSSSITVGSTGETLSSESFSIVESVDADGVESVTTTTVNPNGSSETIVSTLDPATGETTLTTQVIDDQGVESVTITTTGFNSETGTDFTKVVTPDGLITTTSTDPVSGDVTVTTVNPVTGKVTVTANGELLGESTPEHTEVVELGAGISLNGQYITENTTNIELNGQSATAVSGFNEQAKLAAGIEMRQDIASDIKSAQRLVGNKQRFDQGKLLTIDPSLEVDIAIVNSASEIKALSFESLLTQEEDEEDEQD